MICSCVGQKITDFNLAINRGMNGHAAIDFQAIIRYDTTKNLVVTAYRSIPYKGA